MAPWKPGVMTLIERGFPERNDLKLSPLAQRAGTQPEQPLTNGLFSRDSLPKSSTVEVQVASGDTFVKLTSKNAGHQKHPKHWDKWISGTRTNVKEWDWGLNIQANPTKTTRFCCHSLFLFPQVLLLRCFFWVPQKKRWKQKKHGRNSPPPLPSPPPAAPWDSIVLYATRSLLQALKDGGWKVEDHAKVASSFPKFMGFFRGGIRGMLTTVFPNGRNSRPI